MLNFDFISEDFLILIIIISAVLFLIVASFFGKRSAYPYQRLTSILTPAEQHFYKVLSSVINDRAIIMSKVRIADLIKVKSSVKRKHFWGYFSKISQKHIDYVLIDPTTFKTICLIELDDISHFRPRRSNRDKFVDRVMKEAGIPLYRFRVKRRYNRNDILQIISPSLYSQDK